MNHNLVRRVFTACLGLILGFGIWVRASPAQAFEAPELLPAEPTSIVDLAQALTSTQKSKLDKDLDVFEQDTGWKLRILTQYDRTPGRAIKDFWNLDENSVLLVADSRGGNILNFNVGDSVYQLLPRTFWVELQTRFGNQYFVQENGEDESIIQAIDSVKTCLNQGGCRVVPGLPQEQWIFTLITSVMGGIICGFSAHPRTADQTFAWQWMLIFSPLWGICFFSFGLGPVLARTSEWLPILRNVAGFSVGFLIAFLTPIYKAPPTSEV
ncbi:TPM domain-containing protein [Acaryochloris sp. 'Moss Beach']|uniref:TPM domain-containing protein n=1 Tax=Acaryochloris sp. 'Moss Beach' TaxID=2740837 RepID=UPI001F2CBA6D|nr:TPM domain-containing protein [Acaryochloris sp. 'Moss Beach']UJB71180.1 TPM domain-containing protein [Acaryochloris sp. 'Moss Beach']